MTYDEIIKQAAFIANSGNCNHVQLFQECSSKSCYFYDMCDDVRFYSEVMPENEYINEKKKLKRILQ